MSTDTYTAARGWVDEAKIRKYAFEPDPATLVFVCGVPAMYKDLCGPREEPLLREDSVLAELGYTRDMLVKL